MTAWDAETVGLAVAGLYTLGLVAWALVTAVCTLFLPCNCRCHMRRR